MISKPMSTKIFSALGYVIAVTGLLFLLYRHYIISTNPIAIIIQASAFCLMIWARITFKSRSFHLTANPTKGGLVTSGPYKWLRHPIYAAVIYFSWACLIPFPNIETLIGVVLITVGMFIRLLLEEKALIKMYPEYAEYSKQAKRLVPFVF